MKITSKLILCAALVILLTAATVGTFFFVETKVKSALEGQHLANSIHKSVAELDILTYEYLLYREKRMESQWYLKHNMLGGILKKGLQSVPSGTDRAQFMENIRSANEDFGILFAKVVEIHSKPDRPPTHSLDQPGTANVRTVLEEKLVGRMLITSQEMISNASRLNALTLGYMDEIENREVRIMTLTMTIFAALLMLLLFLLGRSIIKPLNLLMEGTRIIGEGNLHHRVVVNARDEIGKLALSFNRMTENLQATTASRDELNIEIQERTRAEKEARQSKDEWEKTFNAMTDIITILDMDMRVIRANKAANDIFQVEQGALKGKHCYEIFGGGDTRCPHCPGLPTLEEGEIHSATIFHPNLGKTFQVSSAPILDKDGEVTHIVHIAKDITEQKKMEDDLFQAHKMEAIGTLAGGIAHDFNNILGAILGYADLAGEDMPEGSSSREFIDEVMNAGNRAKELVKQILTFSRKGAEGQQLLRPASIIKEGLKLMRASLPTTIEIQETIDADCPPILANPTNVHQVLVNLCTNALHAMENQKGILTVALSQVALTKADIMGEMGIKPGPFIELKVKDTGSGMDEETVNRIFEPYFTTKEVGKGSGMGLALVHGIVQHCGGFVKVESMPGKGSVFHVYFPAHQELGVEDETTTRSRLPQGHEHILAVDDEASIVKMYQTTLKRLGYRVSAYTSSENALKSFQAAPENFDLIITDQTMPHIDGSELATQMLKIRPDIPIIMFTGFSSIVSKEQAKEIGINRFIMKPVDREDLAVAVRQVLDERR